MLEVSARREEWRRSWTVGLLTRPCWGLAFWATVLGGFTAVAVFWVTLLVGLLRR